MIHPFILTRDGITVRFVNEKRETVNLAFWQLLIISKAGINGCFAKLVHSTLSPLNYIYLKTSLSQPKMRRNQHNQHMQLLAHLDEKNRKCKINKAAYRVKREILNQITRVRTKSSISTLNCLLSSWMFKRIYLPLFF